MINIQIPENYNFIDKSLKERIESFFLSVYPANHLISHGLEHHRRVWKYATELLNNSPAIQSNSDPLFLRKLMIACYFHDIGMSHDHGVNHGAAGKKQCIEFMRKNNLSPAGYNEALEAIEFHDDKDYNKPSSGNRILTLLSIADDLDAFGFIGIYRYTDIYIRRCIKPQNLGILISKNAAGRYGNFISGGEFSESFIEKHFERFRILKSFFEKYNEQLPGYIFGSSFPFGYCGVVDIIISSLDNESESTLSNIFTKYSKDPVVSWFSSGLTAELIL